MIKYHYIWSLQANQKVLRGNEITRFLDCAETKGTLFCSLSFASILLTSHVLVWAQETSDQITGAVWTPGRITQVCPPFFTFTFLSVVWGSIHSEGFIFSKCFNFCCLPYFVFVGWGGGGPTCMLGYPSHVMFPKEATVYFYDCMVIKSKGVKTSSPPRLVPTARPSGLMRN